MITKRQLQKIWESERQKFAAIFPLCANTKLVLRTRHYLPVSKITSRDLAWYEIDKYQVCLLRSALKRSAGQVRGILRHELGHAVDPKVAMPGAEKRADILALKVTGACVRYTKDGLQHATHGKPYRPAWLVRKDKHEQE